MQAVCGPGSSTASPVLPPTACLTGAARPQVPREVEMHEAEDVL